jgi:electron transfer flavoprotein beta subunit
LAHVVVALVPIVDPQLATRQLTVADGGDLALGNTRHVLGPFDEAALETALTIRDKSPGSTLSVLVFGGAEANETLRFAMALKADKARWIAINTRHGWDARAIANAVSEAVRSLPLPADLLLMGPEFGDHDDGLVPPLVARALGWTFFQWAFQVAPLAEGFAFTRDAGDFEERLATHMPVVATVSTHPSVRLRLPLLKNIMAANRQQVATEQVDGGPVGTELVSLSLASSGRRRGENCNLIQGDSDSQAAAFASLIRGKLQ